MKFAKLPHSLADPDGDTGGSRRCPRGSAKLQLGHGHSAMVDRTLSHSEMDNCGSAK